MCTSGQKAILLLHPYLEEESLVAGVLLDVARVEEGGEASPPLAGQQLLPGRQVLGAEVLLGEQPVPQVGGRGGEVGPLGSHRLEGVPG